MNSCQADLLHLLRRLDAMSAANVPLRRTLQRFVLEYGWWYEPVELPKRFDLGTPKQCHKNATTLALADDSLFYCEGYALSKGGKLPILHAWVTDGQGSAIDTTWSQPGVAYAGVPFNSSFLNLTVLKNNATISLIDDYQNRFPLLGDLGDRPHEWQEPRGRGVARIGNGGER